MLLHSVAKIIGTIIYNYIYQTQRKRLFYAGFFRGRGITAEPAHFFVLKHGSPAVYFYFYFKIYFYLHSLVYINVHSLDL